MPEGLISEPGFVKKYKDVGKWRNPTELEKEAADEDIEFIGKGSESIVIVHPDNPDKVIAFVHDPSSEAVDISNFDAGMLYHEHRIWQTLFPNHFPRIRAAISGDKARTVRERVSDSQVKPEHPFSEVFEECNKYGLPRPAVDRGSPGNFIVGQDGNEYYIDLLSKRGWSMPTEWEEEKLVEFMNEKWITKSEQEKVLNSVERLKEIGIAKDLLLKKKREGKLSQGDYDAIFQRRGLDPVEDRQAMTRVREMVETV